MNQAVIALLILGLVAHAQQPKALTLSGRIELPNVKGRIDHFSADVKGHRLFMSALGNHTVEVLDIQNGRRLHTIPDLDEPQGVLYDASSNRLFAACAKDGTTKPHFRSLPQSNSPETPTIFDTMPAIGES
jgi:hypothetical protein